MAAHDLTGSVRAFLDTTVLWQGGLGDAASVVDDAAHALVAGVETPAFVSVAAIMTGEASAELPLLIDDALAEMGISLPATGEPDHEALVAAALTRRCQADDMGAQELTQTIHRTFGHRCHASIERLSALDDEFDALEHVTTSTREELVDATWSAVTALLDRADEIYRASMAGRRPGCTSAGGDTQST